MRGDQRRGRLGADELRADYGFLLQGLGPAADREARLLHQALEGAPEGPGDGRAD